MKNNVKRLFSILSLLILIVITTVKCKKDAEEVVPVVDEPKPTAGFAYIKPDTFKFLEYQFTGSSTNYKSLLWQFGDDSTSVLVNPKHTYRFPGKYKVTLTTRNSQGYSAAKEVLLNVVDPTINYSICGENYMKTIGGKFSVNLEAGAGADSGEGSKKLVDQDINTKFLQAGFDGTQKCTFELATPQVVGAYTLTSGNDAPDRDPRFWILQGSLDGIQYTDLHTVTVCPWENNDSSRKQTKLFHFDNYIAYKFYRLYIKSNRGSRVFQLAEWTINKKQP
ncbi:discoidin domain-containing protein [Pedobacter sp. ISL-68]|uniref:PKD domain-containing protein n=1 Tax=unclassified Pedobacter TaxID=2628915 RepID=UPI001BE83EDE|nr:MULTISPECIES: PKD domain-containing protein [unclassified Pedobacter]MBT2560298.1 discoidin domain-containing protein [Pedobacter sp. ISL-64]MBT2589278.1 discoidin domain-containing protein [Pedobacter sp. ISL-68]